MRELTAIDRTKKVFQLKEGEFLKGNWLSSCSDSEFLEVVYRAKSRILEVKDATICEKQEGEQYGEERNQERNF